MKEDSKSRLHKVLEWEDDEIIARYEEENPWGLAISLNLYNCDLSLMQNEKKIKDFVKKLVKFLDMKAFGETSVIRFGENPRVSGFSMIQMIETSAITGHFADNSKTIYLDIFSCKKFRPHATADLCKRFFKAEKMTMTINLRM